MRHWVLFLPLLFVIVYFGSYAYLRLDNTCAIFPIVIGYDVHNAFERGMYYLHVPLAWLDQHLTGEQVILWLETKS